MRLDPARAHDAKGQPGLAERHALPGLPVILESRLVCDFEGQVEWVLGMASPNPFRVLELTEPARRVVDVRHR